MTDELLSISRDIAIECGTRGADSVYVALTRQLNFELLTTDEDQATRGGIVVRTWDLHRGVRLDPTRHLND